MNEVRFRVEGYPPAKDEAMSIPGLGHSYAPRVIAHLRAAGAAIEATDFIAFHGAIGLDVLLPAAPGKDPWDATNYLGGIGDVFEAKARRGTLVHLGPLATIGLYGNDRQVREVHFGEVQAGAPAYEVRVYELGQSNDLGLLQSEAQAIT